MRKQRRQRKIEIFKLEDRVLFEAAGAAEAVEAADHANNPNPDQQHDISESERQEKEAQSAVKHVGPGTALPDPGAAVQDQGAGLAQPGTAHQDPAQKLVDGSADFSNVPDVTEHHSSDVSDFLNADFSDHSAAKLSFSDSLSADGHDLIIVDADAAKDLDLNSLPDNTEVLVLDHNSDAMEQINAYLDSRDGKFDSVKFVVDADPSGADSAQEHLELNGKDVSAADLNAIRDHVAEHGDLSVHTALDDSAPSYSLNPDGDFEHSADGDLHDTVIHPEIDKNITVNTDPADQIDPALANPVEDGRNELVIINSNMADKDAVLSQIGEGRDVLEIDPSQDAMSQIQDYLDAHSDTKYDAVHIMTHGNDLGFYLGSTKVTTADQMSVFNGHMAENGDFMLYGCELASNEHGQSLIQDIADFTGCDVAASTNTTGISGDWALEYNVGVIETANISIHGWEHDLLTYKVKADAASGSGYYSSISSLPTAAFTGDHTVELYSHITDQGTFTVTSGTLTIVSAIENNVPGSYVYTLTGSATVNSGATLIIRSSVSSFGGNGSINVSGNLQVETNIAPIVNLNGGTLNIVSDATVSAVNVSGASSIDSDGVISSLTLNTGGTLNLSSGTVTGTVNRGTLTGAGATFGAVTNYADFTLNSGSVSSLNNNGTFNMSGGTVSLLTNSGVSTAMTGGTITTVDNNSGTFDLSGGTVATLNNISDLTVSGGAIGTLNNRAGGDLAMSGGQITVTLNNSSTGTNEISGTAAVSYLNNSGTLTVSGGTVGTVTNSGTLDVSGGSIDGTIANNAGGSLTFSNTVDAGAISNRGTLNINGVLRIAAASGSVAVENLGGTVNFSGGTLQNTSGAQTGTGIGNTAGGSVINGSGIINGFAYGAEVLLGQSVAGLTFTNNTNNYLFSITVVGDKGGSSLATGEVRTIDDALAALQADPSGVFSINFNLTLSDYGNWSTYLTVNGNYSAITNLASVSSNTVVNGEYIILTMVLNKNITLSTPSTVDGGVTSFRNISVTVNAGSTFTVSSGTTAKFDTVSYHEIESVEGLGTATVTARLKNGSVTLTNEGTLSVQGTLNFTYAEPTTDVNAIVNKGQLIFDGGQFNLNVTVSTGSSKSPLVNGILNENGGTVNVTNGARLNASISSGVSDSALIRNRGTLTIDGGSRLNISGATATKAYAIHNDSVANITDSFIDAGGSGGFYGLFNSNNATATFTVTEVPDYITFPVSATDGYRALYYYLDQIYHIRGTSYSVYNENSFTTVNNVASSGDYTITNGLITGTVKDSAGNVVGIFRDAPLYALIGNIHTQGKVNGQGANASTKLNNITILGDVSNLGTAEISLNNFRLNGNIYNQLSKVLVTGDFMSSDFYYRRSETDTRYYAYYGSSGNKETIEVWNYFTSAIGTNAGGTIYFGPQANKVNFSSTSNYAFYNLTGEMAFANFSNLSSESNPVQIYNQGVFSIDATNADGKVDGMYSLYVKEADEAASLMNQNVGTGNFDTASGISDRGIVNVNINGYNPASPVTNGMTLTGLHVRNTQNSSAAVTNYAGNLTVNGGALSATYSALDNLEVLAYVWTTADVFTFYTITPIANLNDVTSLAGAAYSVRNVGELNIKGSNDKTLFTNRLDFSSNYQGDYTALFNSSVSVYMQEYDSGESNVKTVVYYYWNSAFTEGRKTFTCTSTGAVIGSNATLYHMTSASVTGRTKVDLPSDYVYTIPNTSNVWRGFGNALVAEADATLNNVAFNAEASPDTQTVFENWGNLTVTGIDADNQFKGFDYLIDNGTPYWTSATVSFTRYGSSKPKGDYTQTADLEIGFQISASSIYRNFGTLTLRGVETQTGENEYEYTTGTVNVDGGALVIAPTTSSLSGSHITRLNLVNFSVSGKNTPYAIQNEGFLGIYNGHYDSAANEWIGGSNAYVQATNGTAILNRNTLEIYNSAIINSVNGIEATDQASYMDIVNTTIANNSGWGVISAIGAPSGDFNFLIANSTIAYNGSGGIRLTNSNGKLFLINTIVLNANPDASSEKSVDLVFDNGASLDSLSAGNLYGTTAAETKDLQGKTFGGWDDTNHVYSLVENGPAWSISVAWSYNRTSGSMWVIDHVIVGSATSGAYTIHYDQVGNERLASDGRIGAYVLSGTPPPPPATIIVNTIYDSANFDASHFTEKDGIYSLREVIYAIQNGYLESGDVQFDWNALITQMGGGSDITITVDLGSIGITDNISITVPGSAGVTLTINASGNGDSAFVVNGSAIGTSLSLNNLTLTGATTADNGGAIDIEAGTVNLTNVDIKDGSAALGGAIYLASGSAFLTASGTTFSNNTASSGGAIYNNGGQVTFSGGGNSFSNNQAGNGGAIYNNRGTLSLGGVSFSGNSATVGDGGAIYTVGGTIDMGGTSFSGNSATGNGGAIYNNGSSLSVADGGVFTGNHATENGGAIYNDGNGSLTIQGGEFSGNYTDSGDGGVIYNGSGALDIQGGNFSGNHAAGDGGVIYNGSGALTIQSGEFSDNYTGGDGGVVYNASGAGAMNVAGGFFTGNYAGGNGGAVYNASNAGMTVFAAFGGNHAANGGAIYNTAGILNIGGMFIGNYAETGDGGAIYNESAAGMTVAADFTDNNAANGGAIYNKNGTLAISGGSFEANEARNGNGGAIYHGGAGSLTIDGTRLIGNSAAVQGGAVFSGNGALNVKNSTFTGNMAVAGAAIFSGGFATMDHVVFSGNQASESIVTINGGDLKNLTVSDNTAGSGALFDSLGSKTVIDLSAFYDNNAEILLSAGATLYVINSTFAEGNGDVTKHMITGGDVTILNTTVTGDMADRGDALVDADTIRSVNNIIVGTDASQTALNGSKVEAAYTIMSGTGTQVHGGVDDSNVFGINYRALFGGNTVDRATGTIALLNGSIAETGVWVGYNTENGDLYYSVRPDQLYPRYGIDKVDWKKFGSDTLIARPDNVKITEGLNGNTLPSIGSYWITQDVPTLGIGPGVNNTFIDPSFNGIGWNNNDIYNVVADSLIMNPGFLLNFRNEMPVGGRWYYDFTHAFDDRYSSYVGRFAVTLGRFDLGFVPSGENYISINVNSHVSDDFTRYTTTPYLSDGTPLIPAELESMNSETTAPATEGSFELPEGLEEKLVSYLGRAEIFKNDFDKALDQLLAVNA